MDGEKKKKQQIARRKPGLSIEPPTPRPMEADHFALQLFRNNAASEQPAPPSIPSSIPSSSPTTAAALTAASIPTASAPAIPSAMPPAIAPAVPASSPAITPIAREMVSPSFTPSTAPSIPPSIQRANYYLDATHTGAEQRVYSVMYRETISKGVNERHFSVRELLKKTGILAENTVRRALRGLINKQSIYQVAFDMGDNYGPLYRVYGPKEIEERRNRAGIVIELKSKRILQGGPSTPASMPTSTPPSMPAPNTWAGPAPIPPVNVAGEPPSKNEAMIIHGNNASGTPPASSGPTVENSDDEKLSKIRKLFEQLSNGGQWREERDIKAYEQISQIGIFHIILGLCYSVSKSPEHRMSSLAYAVQSILKHAEDMEEFPAEQLIEIAYRTKRKTLNCIQTGKWTVPEWESGD
jgi:hypothetical protein